jgi:protein gp37
MTKIEWTHETWNPVWGCFGECDYCYARKIAKRFAKKTAEKYYLIGSDSYSEMVNCLEAFIPMEFFNKWYTEFKKSTKYVFVNSMSDIAFWDMDWINKMIEVCENNPGIVFQVLTKFPGKLIHIRFPENVWIGLSAETQKAFDHNIENLLLIESGKHFISFEPLHRPVSIISYLSVIREIEICNLITSTEIYHGKIDWVIAGAETGNQRAITPEPIWIRNIINDCRKFDIPFFFKGWGNHDRAFEGLFYNEFPK